MAEKRIDAGGIEAVLAATVHGGLVVAGAFLVASLLASAGVTVAQSAGYSVTSPPPVVTAVLTALQFVAFLLVGYWYVARVAGRDVLHLDAPRLGQAGWAVLGLVALAALHFAVLSALAAFGVEPATNRVIAENRDQPVALLYLAAVSILFVAPGEELIFRGIVQGLFRRAVGVIPAVVVASATFGLVHVGALVSVPETDPTLAGIAAYVLIAALLGTVLGALYERTRTLLVPIVVHGLWNTSQFLVAYAVETGAVEASL